MKLRRSIWLVLPLAPVAALGAMAATGDDAPPAAAPERPAAVAPPLVRGELVSADLRGATVTLAGRTPNFTTQAKRALKRADKVLDRDSKAVNRALAAWVADDFAGPEQVIAAVGRLRDDVAKLRRTVARLKPRDRKGRRARSYITSSLSQTDKGLRGMTGALVLDDPTAARELFTPAMRSFERADELAARASKALGCKRPCSRAL